MENRKRALPVFQSYSSHNVSKPAPVITPTEPNPPSMSPSPFTTLPAELISIIFLYAVARNPNQTGLWESVKRVRPLASITQVSRQWHRVATCTPELWSTIIVTTQRWFPSEHVDLWLGRAKNSKLDVHLLSDNPKIPRLQVEAWRKVVEVARERVRSLNVIVGGADWIQVKPLFPAQLPALTSANLFIMEASPIHHLSRLSDPSLDAPRLERLVTNNPSCLHFGPCPAMRDLEFTRLEDSQHPAGVLWERIRQLLDKMPNLRHLKVSSKQPPLEASNFARFDLGKLETLNLGLQGRVASVDFLSRIRAPSLKDLTITSFHAEAPPPPEPFPAINLPSLRSIRLTKTSMRQAAWLLDHLLYDGLKSNLPKLKVAVEMDVRGGNEEAIDYELRRRLRKTYDLAILWSSGI